MEVGEAAAPKRKMSWSNENKRRKGKGREDYMSIFDVKNLFAAFRNFSLTDVRFYIIKGLNIKIIVDLFISILISCLSTNSY